MDAKTPPEDGPTSDISPPNTIKEAGLQADDDIFLADDGEEMTRVHPNYRHLLRIQATLISIPFVIAALVVENTETLPKAAVIIPVSLIALAIIIRVPSRRFFARGFAVSADRLRVMRGILFRSDTVVPFGRVQHIDVSQGPLERFFDIATLTLYTAGSHNAHVTLPGLQHERATAMREAIRAHIKRESV